MILLQMGNRERSSNRRVCIKHGAKPTVILYIKLGTEELRGSRLSVLVSIVHWLCSLLVFFICFSPYLFIVPTTNSHDVILFCICRNIR